MHLSFLYLLSAFLLAAFTVVAFPTTNAVHAETVREIESSQQGNVTPLVPDQALIDIIIILGKLGLVEESSADLAKEPVLRKRTIGLSPNRIEGRGRGGYQAVPAASPTVTVARRAPMEAADKALVPRGRGKGYQGIPEPVSTGVASRDALMIDDRFADVED